MADITANIDQLLRTVIRGDVASVNSLLPGVSPNCCDSVRRYPIIVAAAAGHTDLCHLLITSWNVDVNIKGKGGNTALHVASNVETIALLVHSGASVNAVNDVGKTPLITAIERQNSEKVKSLVLFGADCNLADKDGSNALHHHIQQIDPDIQIARLLMESGANINSLTKNGSTPLSLTCRSGNREAAEWLCTIGARVNDSDNNGFTPLGAMVKEQPFAEGDEEKIIEFVEILLQHGSEVSHRTKCRKSPLMLFLEGLGGEADDGLFRNSQLDARLNEKKIVNIAEIVICLLANGTDVNCVDIDGQTALHRLGWCDGIPAQVAKLLLQRGADPNIGDKQGIKPLHLAASVGNVALATVLVEHGANVNSRDEYGSTALHFAAWGHSTEMREFLVTVGSLEDLVDSAGLTASELAERYCSEYFEEKLFEIEECAPLIEFQDDSNEKVSALVASTADDIRPEYFKRLPSFKQSKILKTILEHPRLGNQGICEDTVRVRETIAVFMLKLCQFLNDEDKDLMCEPILSGSVSENTKCGPPDEFDYMIKLEKLGALCEAVECFEPGFVQLRSRASSLLSDDECGLTDCFDSDGCINVELLRRRFSRSIGNVLQRKELYEGSTGSLYNLTAEYPILTGAAAKISLRYSGRHMKAVDISVDLVPVVEIRQKLKGISNTNIPLISENRWDKLLATVKQTRHESGIRVSFSLLETSIFNNMPPNARLGYVLCKTLLLPRLVPYIIYRESADEDDDDVNDPVINSAGITSYLLKNALFTELKMQSERKSYSDCSAIGVTDWSKRIFIRLNEAVNDKCMPSFFAPSINLLADDNKLMQPNNRSDNNIFKNFDQLMDDLSEVVDFSTGANSFVDNDSFDGDSDSGSISNESFCKKQIIIKTILCGLNWYDGSTDVAVSPSKNLIYQRQ